MYKVAVSTWTPQEKLAYGDPEWSRFNASFVNRELDAMSLALLIQEGHPFTTWHSRHWRHGKNFICGQHLGLDFDTEDERSTIETLLGDSFIGKYAALIYTTPSHTPAAPRARVVFLLDRPIQQASNYALSATTLLWMFGGADRQCKDPARFFYGSQGCDLQLCDNVLPLDLMRRRIADYLTTGQNAKRESVHKYKPRGDEEQRLSEALRHIPPWGIDYGEWLAVLMGIHPARRCRSLPGRKLGRRRARRS